MRTICRVLNGRAMRAPPPARAKGGTTCSAKTASTRPAESLARGAAASGQLRKVIGGAAVGALGAGTVASILSHRGKDKNGSR